MCFKGIRKKLYIGLILVLIFSCAFILPCSAVQWTITPNYIGTWTAHYRYTYDNAPDGSGIASGDSVLSYESQRLFNANLFYLFNGAPFGFAEAARFYNLDVTMRDINIEPDSSDNDFWLRFNFALCNRNTVKPLDDVVCYVNLLTANNLLVQEVDYSIKDNIVYVDDTFKHISGGYYKIQISFNFARTNTTTDVDFSDYTRFGITQIHYGRNDDISDVLNEVGDGTITNNVNNANSGLSSNKEVEQNILGSIPDMNSISKPNYDTNLGDLTASFSYLGNAVSGFIDSFGGFYNKLWWTLIGLGLFGSICGIIIMANRGKQQAEQREYRQARTEYYRSHTRR